MFEYLLTIYHKLNVLASNHKKKFFQLLIVLLSILIFFAALFSHYEKISFFNAFYWALTTASTVGYGDIVPRTHAGKIIAMFLMIIGVGVLGFFLTSLSSIVLDFKLGRLFGTMENHFSKNHIVILGFNNLVKNAIDEMLSESHKNIVLMSDIDTNPFESSHLIFIKGDITQEKDLHKTKIQSAKLCIISDRDDARTLIAAMTVRNLYKDIYIIALVAKRELAKALQDLGINDVFASGTFSSKLLMKSTRIPGVSKFFNQLLDDNFKETLLEKKIPVQFIHKTFEEAFHQIKKETHEILVGIKRDGQIFINPSQENFTLMETDRFLLIGE
jgi:voltage-gated potassium channel